jgi:hypothetical protein
VRLEVDVDVCVRLEVGIGRAGWVVIACICTRTYCTYEWVVESDKRVQLLGKDLYGNVIDEEGKVELVICVCMCVL